MLKCELNLHSWTCASPRQITDDVAVQPWRGIRNAEFWLTQTNDPCPARRYTQHAHSCAFSPPYLPARKASSSPLNPTIQVNMIKGFVIYNCFQATFDHLYLDSRVLTSHGTLVLGLWGPAHGCQMAKFDPFLSLDCARVEGVGAQSKERKGSNFAA